MAIERSENTPETMYGIFSEKIESLKKTLDYTTDSLKDEILSTKNIFKIWGLCANLVSDLTTAHFIAIHLEKARKDSLEYDFYDEICDSTESLESKLEILKKVCFSGNEEDIHDCYFANYFDCAMGQVYLNKMKEACGEEEVAGFLNFTEKNVRFQILALPGLLEVLITSLREMRTLQFDRTNHELLEIFLFRKQEYEENTFPQQWRQYRGMIKRAKFAFEPMNSNGLKEEFGKLTDELMKLKLGEVYFYDYDSEETRAYEYNRLQCKHEEWEEFFLTVLKYEYLKKLIENVMEAENCSKKTRFPANITFDIAVILLKFLKEKEFIAEDTDSDSFMYLMGCSNEKPRELKKIKFLQNKQILRELLEKAFFSLLDGQSLTKAEIERIAPEVFVDKKGKGIKLAKNKLTPSTYSDLLVEFFSKI